MRAWPIRAGKRAGRATSLLGHENAVTSLALTPDGSYVYDVSVSLDRMKAPAQGRLEQQRHAELRKRWDAKSPEEQALQEARRKAEAERLKKEIEFSLHDWDMKIVMNHHDRGRQS